MIVRPFHTIADPLPERPTVNGYVAGQCRGGAFDNAEKIVRGMGGHEKAEQGSAIISPQAIVLNSDHEHGVYARLDLTRELKADDVARGCVRLAEG